MQVNDEAFDRSLLFDGFAVYQQLSANAKERTKPINVSDVLDALAKITKPEKAGAGWIQPVEKLSEDDRECLVALCELEIIKNTRDANTFMGNDTSVDALEREQQRQQENQEQAVIYTRLRNYFRCAALVPPQHEPDPLVQQCARWRDKAMTSEREVIRLESLLHRMDAELRTLRAGVSV